MRGSGREGEPPPAPEPLPRPALDTHCHLDLMGVPVAEAITAARAVGVERLVSIGVDVATSRWQVEVAQAHPEIYAAVAIHPNEATVATDKEWAAIADLAAEPKVVAIGETGLDHFRTGDDGWRQQEESFRRHIDIAKRSDRALVIHDREAHDDVLRVLAAEGPPARVIFHCFSGDAGFARRCAGHGYAMSFAGNVTFKNADDLRAAAAAVPADLLLVETDAPFLTPMPYRGRPNAPYLIPLTLAALAEVRAADIGDLADTISANAGRIFGWK